MYTFHAIVQKEGTSAFLSRYNISDRFNMVSPLQFPFNCGKFYDNKVELNKEQIEFLEKLLEDKFDSFFRNYIEFSFEYIEIRKI